jgi:elongation factor G
MMGTAYKNKGIQPLLDGVTAYLPNPTDVSNSAVQRGERDPATNVYAESQIILPSDIKKPFVGLAFKLEERPFGQLTYMRIYQGKLTKGDYLWDTRQDKRVKIQRIVKMHANSMEDISEAWAGEIIALFGVDCSSGTTFVANEGLKGLSMTSMHVPEPVISLSIAPKNAQQGAQFSKALNRFQKEDPTFRVHVDPESQETIISGMGELHLEIYVERMKREYKVESIVGQPKVNYRETCSAKASFNYTHKKQTGGQGQYGKVVGFVEPLEEGSTGYEFENRLVGNVIPPEFYPGIEKGFRDAVEKGLAGYPVQGVRIVLTDGGFHAIDSSEIAFRTAAVGAFREAFRQAKPQILEPIMAVEIEVPQEHQGSVVAMINRRKGMIENVEALNSGFTQIKADVPLSRMFGYSTDLRSSTEGKGEFTMEYRTHAPVPRDEQNQIMEEFERKRIEIQKSK